MSNSIIGDLEQSIKLRAMQKLAFLESSTAKLSQKEIDAFKESIMKSVKGGIAFSGGKSLGGLAATSMLNTLPSTTAGGLAAHMASTGTIGQGLLTMLEHSAAIAPGANPFTAAALKAGGLLGSAGVAPSLSAIALPSLAVLGSGYLGYRVGNSLLKKLLRY